MRLIKEKSFVNFLNLTICKLESVLIEHTYSIFYSADNFLKSLLHSELKAKMPRLYQITTLCRFEMKFTLTEISLKKDFSKTIERNRRADA